LTFFKEPIKAITVIDPGKTSFDFPALLAVPLLAFIFGRSPFCHGRTVLSIFCVGDDSTFPQLLSERIAVVAFVESGPFGTTAAVANFDAINRFQNFALIVPVGFAQREVEWIAIGVYSQVAFDPANTMFSRIAYLVLAPFFDFTTLASW
jgi:hypothetical protein